MLERAFKVLRNPELTKATVCRQVEEMRYAGPGTFGSRRIVDEYDAKLSEANARCEKNRKRYDRMAKLLVNAKAGIEHLFDLLQPVKVRRIYLYVCCIA
jgi:hypothetical protein